MILSLGDFLWSLLVIFFMVIYFMMLFQVIVDIFRRHDASGGKKALWLLFLLCVPLVGLLAYMITNSESMAERSVQSAKQSQAEFDSYVQNVAESGGAAGEMGWPRPPESPPAAGGGAGGGAGEGGAGGGGRRYSEGGGGGGGPRGG